MMRLRHDRLGRASLLMLAVLLLSALAATAQTHRYDDAWNDSGLNLTRQGADGVSLTFSLDRWELGVEQIDGRGQSVIHAPGVMLPNEAGAPNLPAYSQWLAVPEGASVRVEVVSYREEILRDVDLAPAPVIPLETEDGPLTYTRDAGIYARDAFYPEKDVQVGEVTQIRGVDAVLLGVSPFRYNPVSRELVVRRDLELKVTFEGGRGEFGEPRLRNRWFDTILDDVFANGASLPAAPAAPASRGRTPDYEYVIITATDFTAWADSLALFRNEQGIRTGVYTPDMIGGNTTGAIEAFVDDAYANWDVPPVAVLLLGDYGDGTDGLPSPMWDSYCVSDNIYADVTNNDMPDVIFARMTAATPAHAETFVRKVIDYERTPPTTPGFYDNPIIAGGWQTERWFILCDEVLHGFMTNELGKSPVREYAIYSGTPGSTWSTATNTSTVVDHFGPSGLGYLPATPAHLNDWGGNASRLNADLNAGAFILQHRDHGGEDGWGEPDYTNSDLSGLNNQDLTFVFSINCLTGKYNYSSECFAEAFHRHGQGALGLIAASEISYSFVNDTYVWGMYDHMWPDFDPGYGAAGEHEMLPAFGNAAGKYFLAQSSWPYNTSNKEVTYHLFHHHGDAFSRVATEMPQAMNVVHEDALLSGVDFFNVEAPAGALIGLSVNGELIGSAVSQGGSTTVPIPAQLPGNDLQVTVTRQNHYRYSTAVTIIPPEGPWVIHSGHDLNDAEGNGNGRLDFGESSLLALELHNVGLETSIAPAAVLSSSDPYLTIDNGVEVFGDIVPDGYATMTDTYHLSLAPGVPDGHRVPVTVTVSDADSTYTSGFELTAHAPVLGVPAFTITNDDDDDGVLDPGETADLTVTLENTGGADVLDLIMALTANSANVTVNSGDVQLATLAAGGSTEAVYNVTASSESPIGDPAFFGFDVAAVDHAYAIALDLVIGLQIEDFESGDLSGYPWTLAGDADWFVSDQDPFEGQYCAKSGGITHNQSSDLVLEAMVLVDGLITFQYKVDSESTYDFLRFSVDGVELGSWSGSVGWSEAVFPVTAGLHVFQWSYDKDGSVSSGADCGWVDHIVFPAVTDPPQPLASVSVSELDVSIPHTQSSTEVITLLNGGEGELEYQVELALDVPQVEMRPELPLKKGAEDPREGSQMARGTGGPDPFGYSWIDSDEPGGPVYDWVEINAVGTAAGSGDDSNHGPFDLGFDFDFYGVTFDQIRICTNGWASFTSTSTDYSNDGIPTAGEPNNLLAVLWDDLNPNDGGTIYYYADAANERFIVEWDGVPHYSSGGGPEYFQAIINADGTILYQYKTTDSVDDCTVGIENAAGDTGLEANFNTTYLHDEMAILFTHEPLPEPWMTMETLEGIAAPGASVDLPVLFETIDSPPGDYYGMVTVHTNDMTNPLIQIPVHLLVTPDATGVEDGMPMAYDLQAAVPNPFNPTTRIAYSVPRDGRVSLNVFDVAGRLVTRLVNGRQTAGRYEVQWNGRAHDGREVASGVYYYRLEAGDYTATRKMTLVK